MRSAITERGQTVIPAAIRRHFGLTPADRLEWVLDGDSLRVTLVKADPIQAFRGKGGAPTRNANEALAAGYRRAARPAR